MIIILQDDSSMMQNDAVNDTEMMQTMMQLEG